MQKRKNIRLLISLLVLSVLTAGVVLYEEKKPELNENAKLFTVENTALVDQVIMTTGHNVNNIRKTASGWQLNDKYLVDENLSKVMLAVLERVRVKRPVAKVDKEAIKQKLKKDGVQVQIFSGEQLVKEFYSGGNATQTETYFWNENDEEVYLVALPGYKSFVAGLFSMKENDWRDRTIFQSHWQTIQNVTLIYNRNTEQSFEIDYQDRFFEIPGVNQLDTTAMMSYLETFNYFPADRIVSKGEVQAYDSLMMTQPWFSVSLRSIEKQKNNQLNVFPKLQGQNTFLAVDNRDRMLLLSREKVQALARKKSDFVRK